MFVTVHRVTCIRCIGASRMRQADTEELIIEDETTGKGQQARMNSQRLTRSQGLTRRDAFEGQRVALRGGMHCMSSTCTTLKFVTVHQRKPKVAYICCSGASRTKPAGTQGLMSEHEINCQRLTSQGKQSKADKKSSQGLTRRDAFKGQRVVACTPAGVNTIVPSDCAFSFFVGVSIETCGYVRLQCRACELRLWRA